MEFYGKFVGRFQDISKVKNPAASKANSSNFWELSKENNLGEYHAITLAMPYLKVLMIWFDKSLKLILQMQPSFVEIYVLNITT